MKAKQGDVDVFSLYFLSLVITFRAVSKELRRQDGGRKQKSPRYIYDLSLHYSENTDINAPSAEKIHQRFSVIQSDDRTQVSISFQLQRRASASKRKINDLRWLPGELVLIF